MVVVVLVGVVSSSLYIAAKESATCFICNIRDDDNFDVFYACTSCDYEASVSKHIMES